MPPSAASAPTHVFHRNLHLTPPRALGGQGVYLFDDTGKRYLDASGGAAVSCLGHGDAEVIAALQAQAESLAYAHTGFFTSEPAERVAARLAALAPGDLNKVYFVSGGSEAVETALKLARQYAVERGEPGRTRFISRRQSYHGNTLGALAIGGNAQRRALFEPLLMQVDTIAPCYAYRGQGPGESEQDYGQRVANELEEALARVGADSVLAFVAETVVGATAGAVPPVPGYFKRVRQICDDNGILLILDEIMCGMGRTGTLFACEQDGVVPDIATIAKGLGGGYQPIGAVLCSDAIHDTIRAGSGAFRHGHTYIGHPMGAAVADVVLTKLTDGGLVDRCARMGQVLQDALQARFGAHPHVGDIRGRGLFRALELVADRDSATPFDPDRALAARLKTAAFDLGLICYPMSGTVDGVRGDHVLLAPPFILTTAQVEELVDKLDQALALALTP